MGANATTKVPSYAAGQVLTAADLSITNSGIPVFANTTDRDAAFGGTGEKTLAEGQMAYVENLTGIAQLQYYDGAAWVSFGNIGSDTAYVATAQTTTSTSYTDLATVGPTVTLTTGTKVLVIVQASIETTSSACTMSFAVSGATTVAASDNYALFNKSTNLIQASATALLTVTAGSNTFTAKYKTFAGTATYERRSLHVINLGS